METLLLGETAAKCIDAIDAGPFSEDAEIVAVGIVVVVRDGARVATKTSCSEYEHYRQVGLFDAALDCVKTGQVQD